AGLPAAVRPTAAALARQGISHGGDVRGGAFCAAWRSALRLRHRQTSRFLREETPCASSALKGIRTSITVPQAKDPVRCKASEPERVPCHHGPARTDAGC